MAETAEHASGAHRVARTRMGSRAERQEVAVFAAATLATWTHTIDELRIGEFVAVPFGVANVAFVAAWGSLATGTRAALAIAFGLLWGVAVIPYHIVPLLAGSGTWQDVSGLSRLVGGAAMVALGVALARRRRG